MIHKPRETVLISESAIEHRIAELAQQISVDYANKEIILLGVLNGAFVFLSDLMRKIPLPLKIGFLSLSSYQGETTAQTEVKEIPLPLPPLENQHVILVEDIFDTGKSINYAYQACLNHRPESLKTCVFLVKTRHETPAVAIDYKGFDIPDVFVVGYGLDYRDHYRQLPYVAQLDFD